MTNTGHGRISMDEMRREEVGKRTLRELDAKFKFGEDQVAANKVAADKDGAVSEFDIEVIGMEGSCDASVGDAAGEG